MENTDTYKQYLHVYLKLVISVSDNATWRIRSLFLPFPECMCILVYQTM